MLLNWKIFLSLESVRVVYGAPGKPIVSPKARLSVTASFSKNMLKSSEARQ